MALNGLTFEEVLDVVGVALEWKSSNADGALIRDGGAPFHAFHDLIRFDFANGENCNS
jgi:hypothetical protein